MSFDISKIDFKSLRTEYESRNDSWYKPSDNVFSNNCLMYFKMIESVFRVQYQNGEWDFIVLQPHQMTFHSKDIALTRGKCKHFIETKSRNTSFTVDSVLRLLTGNYYYHDEIVPIVRINENKVKEIISEIKAIIKHMRPLKMPDGTLFPFDPNKVSYSTMSISFDDIGVVFQGYTSASPDSAENIRGVRTSRGLLDECNFFPYWDSIWGAMNGANRGVDKEGNMHFQVTMGTTLRGVTPYLEWLKNVKSKREELQLYDFIDFPVFDPIIFNPDISPKDQSKLKPIVFWHNMQKLSDAWLEDKDKFMEEYMAVIAPTEGALFDMKEVIAASVLEGITQYDAREYVIKLNKDDVRYMGVDCAGDGTDYFSISIMNYNRATKEYTHLYQYNQQRTTDPDAMVDFILDLYKSFDCSKIRIDANDLGYFISQKLKAQLGGIVVESIRGNVRVKGREVSIPIKEFTMQHLIKQIRIGKMKLISDELVEKHFTMWKKDYSCERSKQDGHGDSVDAIGLASLPVQWKLGITETIEYDFKSQIENKEVQENFGNDLKTRIEWYRKCKKGYF